MNVARNFAVMNPLYNGVKVLSSINRSIPFVRIGVAVQAGSRYENHRDQGSSHFLRLMHACSTEHATIVEMTKRFEYAGASFSALNSRDSIIYWLECINDKLEDLVPFMMQAILAPKIYAWELEDCKKRAQLEVEMQKSSIPDLLSDLTHQASFKGGLSNNLLTHEDNIDKFWNLKLRNFHHNNFTSDRMTLVAVGSLPEDYLQNLGQQIEKSTSNVDEPSTFYPRELRKYYRGNFTYVTMAFNSCSNSEIDLIQFALLEEMFGSVEYSNMFSGQRFLQNFVQQNCENSIMVGCQNITYNDNGIFNIVLCCSSDDSEKAVKSIISAIQEFADPMSKHKTEFEHLLNSARLRLTLKVQNKIHCPRRLTDNLASGGVYKLFFMNPERFEHEMNSTGLSTLQNIFQNMLRSGFGYASLGNLSNVPYRDELKL